MRIIQHREKSSKFGRRSDFIKVKRLLVETWKMDFIILVSISLKNSFHGLNVFSFYRRRSFRVSSHFRLCSDINSIHTASHTTMIMWSCVFTTCWHNLLHWRYSFIIFLKFWSECFGISWIKLGEVVPRYCTGSMWVTRD